MFKALSARMSGFVSARFRALSSHGTHLHMERGDNPRGQTRQADSETLRIALVGTPRSGNTWFRHLVATSLELEHLPVYNPLETDWETLPKRCILMTHWHRTDPFLSLLHDHNFRVLTLARHPLDVLISILHFTVHNPETGKWLNGDQGNELSIVGKSPLSPEFLEYAMGPRAKALLSVSPQWCLEPGAQLVRYEDLVRDPRETLTRVVSHGRSDRQTEIAAAIEKNTLESLRSREGLHHWRGRPGHWKQLLPATLARQIADHHAEIFQAFSYDCDPDEALTAEQAEAQWKALACAPRDSG